jgi:nucleoside-diphosphate-sugar epimerase
MAILLATGIEKLGEILNFNPPLSRSRVKTFCGNRAFSTAKARTDLGYVPTVTIDEGIQRTANWYKQNGWL